GWVAPWRYGLPAAGGARAPGRARPGDGVGVGHARPLRPARGQVVLLLRGERAFVAYRVVGGVAIVSGDPIGPPSARGDLLDRFIAFARERGWRLAILGASEQCLELYRPRDLHALYHG